MEAAWPTQSVADGRPDELHRVVHRKAGGHMAARRVDVHRDFLLRILRFEEQELRDDNRGHHILDHAGHEDDALFQKPRIDIEGALAAVRLLDDHRDKLAGVVFYWIAHAFLPGVNEPRRAEFG